MKTSESSGPSSAGALTPAEFDAPKLKAILRRSKPPETEREWPPNDEPVLEALSEGELGGVGEKGTSLEWLRTAVE